MVTSAELSWQDFADGTFPLTRQQCFQQAAVRAVEQLHEHPDVQVTHDRLTKAMDLVLSSAVTINPDGTATVKSGSRAYQINGECTCADAQHRTKHCKHALAVLIHKRATALLQGTAHDPAPAPERAEPTASQPRQRCHPRRSHPARLPQPPGTCTRPQRPRASGSASAPWN